MSSNRLSSLVSLPIPQVAQALVANKVFKIDSYYEPVATASDKEILLTVNYANALASIGNPKLNTLSKSEFSDYMQLTLKLFIYVSQRLQRYSFYAPSDMTPKHYEVLGVYTQLLQRLSSRLANGVYSLHNSALTRSSSDR